MAAMIAIAAAIFHDGGDRLLLVRKHATPWFMQPGGKIDPGDDPRIALLRELREELGLSSGDVAADYLDRRIAPAANEPGAIVDARLFAVTAAAEPVAQAEIAELRWVERDAAVALPLAPLTRDHVLPLFDAIRSNAP